MLNPFRKKQPKKVKLEAIELSREGYCAVVGESHYQEALQTTSAICTPGPDGRPTFRAVLIAEPDNPYDSNAIAIHSPKGKLGYLSRDNARAYRPVMNAIAELGFDAAACKAHLTGGQPDKPSFGVVLRIADPEECLAELREEFPES